MGFFWEMVTVAVVMGTAIPISVLWIRHREKLAEIEACGKGVRIEELEARMKVMERIVTDRGYDVAAQIEALRDQRRVEDLIERSNNKEEV